MVIWADANISYQRDQYTPREMLSYMHEYQIGNSTFIMYRVVYIYFFKYMYESYFSFNS